MRPAPVPALACVSLAALLGGCGSEPPSEVVAGCASGAYRLDTGELLILSPSSEGTLRYRFVDGRSGRLFPQGKGELISGEGWDAREPLVVRLQCRDERTLQWLPARGEPTRGSRLALRSTSTRFERDGLSFDARLVLPLGEPRALVVRGHGSERDAATLFAADQYLFPAHDIAILVYDKRGTGASGGDYTQDFHVLADDMVAAVAHARTLLPKELPLGVIGGSQGGWIAPLAATRTHVDFVIASFGLAESPLAEDREEVQSELRARGYGEEVLAKARRLTDATGKIMASKFESGYEELRALEESFGGEPWLEGIEGEFTGQVLRYPAWIARLVGPWYDVQTSWNYDPVPVLRAVDVPMLWVLAGKDNEAPSETTFAILRSLQAGPAQLDIARFPNADHGIIEFRETPDGRQRLGHSQGYFDLLMHWARERTLAGAFGTAQLYPDPVAPGRSTAADALPAADSSSGGGLR